MYQKSLFLILLVTFNFYTSATFGILIHEENDPKEHYKKAQSHPYACSVLLKDSQDQRSNGSGVYIKTKSGKKCVLTAAHVAKGKEGGLVYFDATGECYEVDSIHLHPHFDLFQGIIHSFDIAILKLKTLPPIKPATLDTKIKTGPINSVVIGSGIYGKFNAQNQARYLKRSNYLPLAVPLKFSKVEIPLYQRPSNLPKDMCLPLNLETNFMKETGSNKTGFPTGGDSGAPIISEKSKRLIGIITDGPRFFSHNPWPITEQYLARPIVKGLKIIDNILNKIAPSYQSTWREAFQWFFTIPEVVIKSESHGALITHKTIKWIESILDA